jgi:hypothetical protein
VTFAKQAADLLASNEAEEDRGKQKSHWRDYLATGLGLAGLGAGAYYGHKYWPQISKGVNDFVSPPQVAGPNDSIAEKANKFLNRPEAPGLLEKNTGASSTVLGALAGGAGGELGLGKYRLPWNHKGLTGSLGGLGRLSSGAAPGTEASAASQTLDKSLGGKTVGAKDTVGGDPAKAARGEPNMARHAGNVMDPTTPEDFAHPLRQAYNLATGKEMPAGNGMWRTLSNHFRGPHDLAQIQAGLRQADQMEGQPPATLPSAPAEPRASRTKGQLSLGGPQKILEGYKGPSVDPKVELAQKIRQGMPERMKMRPSDFANRLESMKGLSGSTLSAGKRVGRNALLGGAAGYLANRGFGL